MNKATLHEIDYNLRFVELGLDYLDQRIATATALALQTEVRLAALNGGEHGANTPQANVFAQDG